MSILHFWTMLRCIRRIIISMDPTMGSRNLWVEALKTTPVPHRSDKFRLNSESCWLPCILHELVNLSHYVVLSKTHLCWLTEGKERAGMSLIKGLQFNKAAHCTILTCVPITRVLKHTAPLLLQVKNTDLKTSHHLANNGIPRLRVEGDWETDNEVPLAIYEYDREVENMWDVTPLATQLKHTRHLKDLQSHFHPTVTMMHNIKSIIIDIDVQIWRLWLRWWTSHTGSGCVMVRSQIPAV